MKSYFGLGLAMLVGAGFGAAAVSALNAQATPPAFYIAMNDVHDQANYIKEFVAKTTPTITAAGGHFLARGGAVTGLKGEPPKSRIVLIQFDSMDKLLAWWKSPPNADAQKIGDKYATIHSFAVEGMAQ